MSFTHTHHWTRASTPDRVFKALTDPTELQSWFAEPAEVEPRAGGAYRFWGTHTLATPSKTDARQRITTIEPASELVFEWPMLGADTTVSMRFDATEKGTRLS